MTKYGPAQLPAVTTDAALAIGEEVFRAGYRVAAARARAFHPLMIENSTAHEQQAWLDYDPSQLIKDLVR